MKICSTRELRSKEVINVCDGKRIGCPSDFEFDPTCGKIISLIVPGESGFFCFGSKNEIIIPWGRVECFGEDTILVRVNLSECSPFSGNCEGNK